jgi:hypothetical protein
MKSNRQGDPAFRLSAHLPSSQKRTLQGDVATRLSHDAVSKAEKLKQLQAEAKKREDELLACAHRERLSRLKLTGDGLERLVQVCLPPFCRVYRSQIETATAAR